jgi:hypothetical protein
MLNKTPNRVYYAESNLYVHIYLTMNFFQCLFKQQPFYFDVKFVKALI